MDGKEPRLLAIGVGIQSGLNAVEDFSAIFV